MTRLTVTVTFETDDHVPSLIEDLAHTLGTEVRGDWVEDGERQIFRSIGIGGKDLVRR